MTNIIKFSPKHLKILRMLLSVSLSFCLFGISEALLLDNGTLTGVHNGSASLELSNLTKSLILASSPFINLSDKSEEADGATVSKQLLLQNTDHRVPIVFGSPSDTLRDGMDIGENNGVRKPDDEMKDTDVNESQIHEVRVKAPFLVTKEMDRNGKSLYSPGPTTERYAVHRNIKLKTNKSFFETCFHIFYTPVFGQL